MNKVIQCNVFHIPKLEEMTEFPDRLDVEHKIEEQAKLWLEQQRKVLLLTMMRRLQQSPFNQKNCQKLSLTYTKFGHIKKLETLVWESKGEIQASGINLVAISQS